MSKLSDAELKQLIREIRLPGFGESHNKKVDVLEAYIDALKIYEFIFNKIVKYQADTSKNDTEKRITLNHMVTCYQFDKNHWLEQARHAMEIERIREANQP